MIIVIIIVMIIVVIMLMIMIVIMINTNDIRCNTVGRIINSTTLTFALYYHIQPNYRTMRSGFSKLLGKLVVKYVSTYTKGTLKKKRSVKVLSNDAYVIFFLIFFIKAYVVGTHLNCIDKPMKVKWVPTTYAFIRKQTKSTLAVI